MILCTTLVRIMSEDLPTDIEKAFGLPETIDASHSYVYRSGAYGLFSYWYKDRSGNYWLYTNAPTDHPDYDPLAGEAVISPDQPMPHTAPQFYTTEGWKRHIEIPEDVKPQRNESYSPTDPRRLWLEVFFDEHQRARYVYRDTDVRENLDLWTQYQLRVTDAHIVKLRKYAVELFERSHPKDKVIAVLLMLVDQAAYSLEELLAATVADIEFIDRTVKILGRKFVCDLPFYDFLTSLVGVRSPSEPLFQLTTHYGTKQVGLHHAYSIFSALRISPHYILYWHATQIYSRILHRLFTEKVPPEEVSYKAMDELSRVLSTQSSSSVEHLVDPKIRDALLDEYEKALSKALVRERSDSYGVFTVFSDFGGRADDELEFSMWLHSQPLHDMSEEEQTEVELDAQAEQLTEEQSDSKEASKEAEQEQEQEQGDNVEEYTPVDATEAGNAE